MLLDNTLDELTAANKLALAAAKQATQDFINARFDGRDGGPCGFAWVTFVPTYKGNTKLGKQERRMIKSLGFEKNYTGKAYDMWNPSGSYVQSVDAKYAGAAAYADTMRKEVDVKIFAADRLD